MLKSAIIRIVESRAQRRWQALLVGILLADIAAAYDVVRFSISTDTEGRLDPIDSGEIHAG